MLLMLLLRTVVVALRWLRDERRDDTIYGGCSGAMPRCGDAMPPMPGRGSRTRPTLTADRMRGALTSRRRVGMLTQRAPTPMSIRAQHLCFRSRVLAVRQKALFVQLREAAQLVDE